MKKLLSGFSIWLLGTALSLGASQVVTSTDDSGPGSLRAAITDAAAGDTITFDLPTPATITLTSGELLLAKKLTITGPGADLLSVKRSNTAGIPEFRVLHITSGNFAVTVSGLTVTNGDDPVDGIYGGGGLYNECSGSVVFVGCRFTDNQAFNKGGAVLHNGSGSLGLTDCGITGNVDLASSGGGLAVEVESGPTTILRCTISSNTGHYFGGGIFNGTGSSMVISDSTISGNLLVGDQFHGDGDGGGICNDGIITLADSTIADNSNGRGNGGGIRNQGTMTVTNSTFFGNSTLFNGGGILNNGPAVMIACTITQNIAVQDDLAIEPYKGGGGISDYGVIDSLMIQDTIVADNHSYLHSDVAGKITSQGYNLIGDGTGGIFAPSTGDQVGTFAAPINPLLGQLANNGGPTETCALLSDSPAIDAGDPQAPISDQRDYDRQDDAVDIGAFELGATIPKTLANISTRLLVGTGENALIGGFIITGTHSKQVILRGIGPSLSLPGKLANPTLELHDDSGAVIGTSDDWQTNGNAQQIIDSGLSPSDPLESALLQTLAPGAYTVVVRGVGGGTGIALVQGYDLDQTTDSRLANISTRGLVQDADNVMIGGFIIGGTEAEDVLLRAIGPSLPVANPLTDPVLELHDGDGTVLATDDNWRDSQEAEIEATGLAPTDDAESAIFMTLNPGNYTAVVRGIDSGMGVALVEAYGLN